MFPALRQRLSHLRSAWDELRINLAYARHGVESRAATDEERSLLLRVPQLRAHGFDLPFDQRRETCVCRRFPNGSISLKYSYEASEAPPGDLPLVLISRIDREPSHDAAAREFQNGIAAYQTGAARVGGRFVFKGNLQAWSDNAFVAFTVAEPHDTIVGCVLSFHKERMVYSVLLRGLVLDREDEIEALLHPFLDRAAQWSAAAA